MENLDNLKNMFISQSLDFFKQMYENKEINKIFTAFYYTLSKKFIKLQPIKSIELTVKYTNKHYNKLMTFDEEFYNNLDLTDIFSDIKNEDDVYYRNWYIKIKNIWFNIPVNERMDLIRLFQCMVMTSTKYFLISNQ